MSRQGVVLGRRTLWTGLVGLAALSFWVVAIGVGWRAWLLTGPDFGIVGHVDAFGQQAAPWGIVAAILTLTTAVMGVGTALTRHVVDIAVAVAGDQVDEADANNSSRVTPDAAAESEDAVGGAPEDDRTSSS